MIDLMDYDQVKNTGKSVRWTFGLVDRHTPEAGGLPQLGVLELQDLRHNAKKLLDGMILRNGRELAEQMVLLRSHVGSLANVAEDVWVRNIANFIDTMWQKILHKSHRTGAETTVWNILKRSQLVRYNASGGRRVWNRDVPEAETQNYLSMVLADI